MEPSPRHFQRFALSALVISLAVIVWGAFVRATGSGAGCGDHWPLCNAQVVPRAPTLQTIIEFVHRLTSGVALLWVVALVALAMLVHPRGHAARRWAVASLVLMLVEAALGALLVKRELVANNASASRAVAMSVHLVNTFLLLAAQTACVWVSRSGRHPSLRSGKTMALSWVGSLALVVAVGVSGAIAALGDTLVQQSVVSPFVDALIRLRIVHPFVALGAVAVTALFAVMASARPEAKRGALGLGLLVAAQLGVGLINVILQAPVTMQLFHLLMADLVWVVLLLVGFEANRQREALPRPAATASGAWASRAH